MGDRRSGGSGPPYFGSAVPHQKAESLCPEIVHLVSVRYFSSFTHYKVELDYVFIMSYGWIVHVKIRIQFFWFVYIWLSLLLRINQTCAESLTDPEVVVKRHFGVCIPRTYRATACNGL